MSSEENKIFKLTQLPQALTGQMNYHHNLIILFSLIPTDRKYPIICFCVLVYF